MKKIIMIALLAFAFTANAQIETEAGTFTKPVAKTIIMEAVFTPSVSGGGIFALPALNSDLGLLGVKIRKFTTDKKAYRLGGTLTVVDSGEEGADTDFAIGVAAGEEFHMAGAERLSTYWGYEANVGYVKNSELDTVYDPYFDEEYETSVETKKFGIGASVFTGFDYYIVPKIYLGAEVSYGLAITNTTPEFGDDVTRIQLSPSITPSFRMGWMF